MHVFACSVVKARSLQILASLTCMFLRDSTQLARISAIMQGLACHMQNHASFCVISRPGKTCHFADFFGKYFGASRLIGTSTINPGVLATFSKIFDEFLNIFR